jgi:hypothetical protein
MVLLCSTLSLELTFMAHDIIIIALDIRITIDPKNFQIYSKKSAIDKIAFLAQRIENLCEQQQDKDPTAVWIITWRENAIWEPDSDQISNEVKKHFKNEMSQLTKKFPQLTLIAGTVRTQKQVKDNVANKLTSIESYYKEHQWILNKENKLKHDTDKTMQRHLERVNALQANNTAEINVIRNTCYIFNNGNIERHDKSSPYRTEFFNSKGQRIPNSIFQPAKGRNKNPIFTIKNPLAQTTFEIGIEICREHFLGLLKQTQKTKPLLHFVLSDRVEVTESNKYGSYFMHIDSLAKPALTIDKEAVDLKLPDVIFYRNNLLQDNDHTLETVFNSLQQKFKGNLQENDIDSLLNRLTLS